MIGAVSPRLSWAYSLPAGHPMRRVPHSSQSHRDEWASPDARPLLHLGKPKPSGLGLAGQKKNAGFLVGR